MGMLSIFSPLQVGPCRLKNRLVALPVYTGYAHPDGTVSSMMVRHYTQLAESGVAIVVVANAAVAADGAVSAYNLRVDGDEFVPGLSRLAQAIKARGALACLQLNHAGRFARTEQPLLPSPMEASDLAFNVASLKDFMDFFPFERRFGLTGYLFKQINTWRRSMSDDDRGRIISSFSQAAARARRAGFDMIELHGAGGYLLCQFLSRFSHKTASGPDDGFEKRAAFPLEVIRKIRRRLPGDYPIGFRLILREGVPGGIELPEALAFARLLEQEGIAYLSASVATYHSMFSPEVIKAMSRPAYLRMDASALTRAASIPTVISGRIIRPALAEELLKEGAADLIGLGRSIRTDLQWVAKARTAGKKITPCVNCNACLKRVVLNQGFNCRRWPRELQERTELEHKLLSRNTRRLFVANGIEDLSILRDSLPFLLPEPEDPPVRISPAILFLEPQSRDEAFDGMCTEFLSWSEGAMASLGFVGSKMTPVTRIVGESHELSATRVIDRGRFGIVLVCRHPAKAWRKRLLYRARGKIVGLVGSNSRRSRVLVPVDMSMATLLALMFLRQAYVGRPGVRLTFAHVLAGPAGPAEQRWREVKKIVGLDEGLPLHFIPSTGNIAADLLKAIKDEEFGTIVMGKRGVSMIKRWLLGSVSAGVLRGLTDQTLFLID